VWLQVSFFYSVVARSLAVATEGVMVVIDAPAPPPAVADDLNIIVPGNASTNIDVLKNDEPGLTIVLVTQPPAGMGSVAIGGSCGTSTAQGIPGCLVYTVGSNVAAETRVSAPLQCFACDKASGLAAHMLHHNGRLSSNCLQEALLSCSGSHSPLSPFHQWHFYDAGGF
jgi:hypothetical protein